MTTTLKEKQTLCDRCGNDFYRGSFAWHLPYIKKYVWLCRICQLGMITGMHLDFTNLNEIFNIK